MLSLLAATTVGLLIGWQFPQPSWAQALTNKIATLTKQTVADIEAKAQDTTIKPK